MPHRSQPLLIVVKLPQPLHLPPFLDSLPGSLPLRRLRYQSTQKYLPETGLRLLLGHFRADKTMKIALITANKL